MEESERKKLYELASTKSGVAISELATKTISIKFSFDDYHSFLKRTRKDIENKNLDQQIFTVEVKGDTNVYLFVAKSFEEVYNKILKLPNNKVEPKTISPLKKRIKK